MTTKQQIHLNFKLKNQFLYSETHFICEYYNIRLTRTQITNKRKTKTYKYDRHTYHKLKIEINDNYNKLYNNQEVLINYVADANDPNRNLT